MIDVRKATADDLELLMKLRIEMLSVVNNTPEIMISSEIRENSERYFRSGDSVTALAFDGNTPVGCATICFIDVMPTYSYPSGVRAHIMNVYTRAEYRRKGTARKMMEMLLEEAKLRGAKSITLDATENGKPLYSALGFRPSAEHMELDLR